MTAFRSRFSAACYRSSRASGLASREAGPRDASSLDSGSPRSALAVRAEVAAAARDNHAADRAAAAATRLAGPLIDAQLGQEISGAALNGDVVAAARALELDPAVPDLLQLPGPGD